jgi:hypothetical protein
MKIENDSYILYDNEAHDHIYISGSLRLNGLAEYTPITQALKQCLNKTDKITIDLSQLESLNSSGIAMLSKFVIDVREKKKISLIIIGSVNIPWQGKSLKNLQRLYPALELIIN